MLSVSKRRLLFPLIAVVLIAIPLLGAAATKKIVRAVYKSGLELQEEPEGTVLADPSVCLPKDNRYDYKGQLVKTVEKAKTRMNASVLDQKVAGYGVSIALLDRNIALITGAISGMKQLDGLTGYLLPIGALQASYFNGAIFEGKCYKAPGEAFRGPDAVGELNPKFDTSNFYIEFAPLVEKTFKEELPRKLKAFAALEENKSLSSKEKEERFSKLTDEVMEKVGDFMAIDTTAAAELMPREFSGRGTRINSTPTISLSSTPQDCIYIHTVTVFGQPVKDVHVKGKLYDITVNAVSVSHTFRKCMPEKQALKMLKDKLVEKQNLLKEARGNFVKLFSDAGKALAKLQKDKPQYFGD